MIAVQPIPDEHLPSDLQGRVTAAIVTLGRWPEFRIYLDGGEVGTVARRPGGWYAGGGEATLHATRAVAAAALCYRRPA